MLYSRGSAVPFSAFRGGFGAQGATFRADKPRFMSKWDDPGVQVKER